MYAQLFVGQPHKFKFKAFFIAFYLIHKKKNSYHNANTLQSRKQATYLISSKKDRSSSQAKLEIGSHRFAHDILTGNEVQQIVDQLHETHATRVRCAYKLIHSCICGWRGWCWTAGKKEPTSFSSEVQGWIKEAWGEANGWHQCLEFHSVLLWHWMRDRKHTWPITNLCHLFHRFSSGTRKRGKAQLVARLACANATVHLIL